MYNILDTDIERLKQVIDNQERVIKEQKEDIERLQAQLDREIHINRKLVRVLKHYADGDFYEADVNLQTNPLTNREEVFSVDIIDNKGNIIYTKAQEVLKEVEEV